MTTSAGYLAELGVIVFKDKTKVQTNHIEPTNKSEIIVVLAKDFAQYHSKYQDLLNKILSSMQSINSKLIYRVIDNSKFDPLQYKFNKIISFGKSDLSSADNILNAPSIDELEANTELKKQLWKQLQTFCKI